MTTRLSAEEPVSESLISKAETVYRQAADEVFAAIQKISSGEWDAKGTTQTVTEMRKFLLLVLEERTKLAKLSDKEGGAANSYALDFDAARIEIGRRLACLRDAGSG
jgi:hypothetical protein